MWRAPLLFCKDSPGFCLALVVPDRFVLGVVVAEEGLCFRIVIVRYRAVDIYTVYVYRVVHAVFMRQGSRAFARCFISRGWGNRTDVNLCDDCLTFESPTLTWTVLRWSIKALFCLRWKLGAGGEL
jgi:hypothetical protein